MSEPAPSSTSSITLKDLMILTKFRLSALVIVSTFVGFLIGSKSPLNMGLL
ncbi:MAG: hypothetical protein JWO94_1794, partial [Verrucomicrobiaceae bacterium]|nr:hypothetical protein [Verrucomicrobiaceae bacterium]